MKLRYIALSVGLTVASVGCATHGAHTAAAERPSTDAAALRPVPSSSHALITLVNTDYAFVVIDFNARTMPAVGSSLNVYRAYKRVGAVRLTEPVRGRFATADITDGTVNVGDEIR